MADERAPRKTQARKLPRRRFMRDAATAATITCFTPGLLLGCRATTHVSTASVSTSTGADAMDQALEMMKGLAPLTNHGPMAAEALVALGRADKVPAFVEAYKHRFRSVYPSARQPITAQNWRAALGMGDRVADWTSFFERELKEAAWPKLLEKWSDILAPGLSAAAVHGLIRTAHAARSLSLRETDLRRRELAEGLGYWAAYYQTLPEAPDAGTEKLRPSQAINRVALLPPEKRGRGSIMIALRSLSDFQPFAGAANLVEANGNADQFLSEVTETFAAAYVKNVNQRNFITLIHAVTGTTALRSLMPHLTPSTTRRMLRYGWQTAAALYSISATSTVNNLPEASTIKRDDLIERAVASQEEHAIKFTEACLREYALNPKQVYLEAARDAVGRLQGF